jgi:hypothetical protein
MRVDEPAVAETRRPTHRPVVVGGEPDRRMRLLDRPAGHRDIGKFADVALAADIVLGPQALDELEALLEAVHASAARHPKGVELDIAIAEPDAEDEVAAPDRVERGDALGDLDRVVQGRQQDACDAGHLAGFGGEPRQKRHQLNLSYPLAEVMLAGGHRVPPTVAGQARHCILTFECRDHVAARWMLAGEKDPDLHDVSMVTDCPLCRGRR